MAAEIIRFQINVPEEVALKYPDGKEVEGRYGPQVMYSLADGRVMYVAPFFADKIRELRLGPGERFSVCKREKQNGRSKGIEWEIRRVDPPGTPRVELSGQPLTTAAPLAAPGFQHAVSTIKNGQPQNNGTAAAAQEGFAEFIRYNTTIATGVLCASIDALSNAEKYAASEGLKIQFNEEDVRALANTLYIQNARGTQPWPR